MFQIPMCAPGKIILQIEKIFSAGPQNMVPGSRAWHHQIEPADSARQPWHKDFHGFFDDCDGSIWP